MSTDELPQQRLLKTKEAGRLLGVTAERVRQLVNEGRLTAVRVGSVLRVRRESVVAYQEQKDKPKQQKTPAKKHESADVYVLDSFLAGFNFPKRR